MSRAGLVAALLALELAAPASFAQPAPAPAGAEAASLDWLAGRWRGEGRRGGETLAATLDARLVLGGRFLELSYSSGGFEGRALYRPAAGGWQGRWFDSRGVELPLRATLQGRTLTADWGDAATERGRTIYRLRDDGRLEILDSVAGADGAFRPFASHLLARAE
jgi:hypothetical protein